MPSLVTVIVFVALALSTSWSAKAPLEPPKTGTAPANSLPSSENVFETHAPGAQPGPSTSKKLLPVGLPTTGTGVAASPMKPTGANAPGAAVRNGPKRPPSAAAKSHTPVVATRQPTSVVVRPRAPAVATLTVSVPYGWVIVYVPAGAPWIWMRTRLKTAGLLSTFGATVMSRISNAVPPPGRAIVEFAM